MRYKLIKILMLMLTIILLLGTSQVLATTNIIDPDFYNPTKNNQNNYVFIEKAGKILGVVNIIGMICSVVVIAVIGLKYMLGSVEEKAEYKKTMITYIIGAVLLFSATTMPNMIYRLVNPQGPTGGGHSPVDNPGGGLGPNKDIVTMQ